DLETNPATQQTKQALLDVIIDKSEGGLEFGETTMKTLKFVQPERGTLTVSKYRKGESKDDPNRLGQVMRVEWPGKLYGEQLITNYFILNSPDGLQMEKHSHTSNPSKEMLGSDATLDDVYSSAINGIAKIGQMRESQTLEDELGLSFVSEAEARDILALVQEAQK
ncbi:MAG: hypothetical protein WCJ24_02295, partial [Candidatus Saccharibacteria bacterium]